MVLIVALVLVSLLAVTLGFILFRISKRLLEFDDIFGLLVDDIDLNVAYLNKLNTTPVFQNSQEVVEAIKKMRVIQVRLDEYVKRMEEQTGRKFLRRTDKPPVGNRPVVI